MDSSGDAAVLLFVRNAWLDSGYLFYVSSGRFLDELPTFSSARWTRILRFLVLHAVAEWSSVLSRCFSLQFRFELLALGNLNTSFTRSTSLAAGVMTDGMAGSPGVLTSR